jgi:hypothetical protein
VSGAAVPAGKAPSLRHADVLPLVGAAKPQPKPPIPRG